MHYSCPPRHPVPPLSSRPSFAPSRSAEPGPRGIKRITSNPWVLRSPLRFARDDNFGEPDKSCHPGQASLFGEAPSRDPGASSASPATPGSLGLRCAPPGMTMLETLQTMSSRPAPCHPGPPCHPGQARLLRRAPSSGPRGIKRVARNSWVPAFLLLPLLWGGLRLGVALTSDFVRTTFDPK